MKRAPGFISRVSKNVLGGRPPFSEEMATAEELSPVMERASLPSFSFFFMLGLASTIATVGLIQNSAPAIIGAMIIAPLMSPILGLSYGLVILDRRLVIRSVITVATGTALVVAIAFTSSVLFGLRLTGSEILSRSKTDCVLR